MKRTAHRSGKALPVAAVLAAVLLWGGSFAAMKTAVAELDPWAAMWARMALASLGLLPFLPRLGLGRLRRTDIPSLALLVALLPCLYFVFEANALTLTTSSQAGVISSAVPLLVAFGAWPLLGERPGPKVLAGLGLAMLGVAVLSLGGAPDERAPNPLLGNALELAAMICAAGYMLVLKRLSVRYGAWTLTALQTFAGALFFLPGAFKFPWNTGMWNAPTIFSLAYLGLGATLGAFGLYNWGLARMPAGQGSAFINLVPVAAVVLGWTLLGETLTPMQITAAAVVGFGVFLSQSRPESSRLARGEA